MLEAAVGLGSAVVLLSLLAWHLYIEREADRVRAGGMSALARMQPGYDHELGF